MSTRYKFSTYEVRVQRINECPGSLRVDTPAGALDYWREKITAAPWHDSEKEMLVTIMLNTRYVAVGHSMISIGSMNECTAHPREIFRPVVATGAYGFVLMHNHPSGDPSPSEADTRLTRRLAEGSGILQVGLLDHVIVGAPTEFRPGYFSFKEAGIL
jgi:DNA repair protein RadC